MEGGREDGKEGGRGGGGGADTELKTKTPHVNVGKNSKLLQAVGNHCELLISILSSLQQLHFQRYKPREHRHRPSENARCL